MLIAELSGVSICLHLANAHTFVLPVGHVEFFFFFLPLSHLCSVSWMSHTLVTVLGLTSVTAFGQTDVTALRWTNVTASCYSSVLFRK